ncbi:MAG: thioredoxin [Gammaproteobacteria bacterium]|nr:MAG: thioredoxin [Gammaproteobacteria bacterium]
MIKRIAVIPFLLFGCLFPSLGLLASQEGGLDQGMVNPGYVEKPAWFKNSFLDLREDIEEAADSDKRIMLYFYQDGCPYCKKLLEDNFGQREISQFTQKHFDVIAINMWGDRDVVDVSGNEATEKKFSENLKVMFTPTFLFLDEAGEVVLRVNGYYHPHKFLSALNYVAGANEKQTSFLEYYGQQAPAKSSGKLHIQPEYLQPPYDLQVKSRKSGKPLMVMFEQKQCQACDELHMDIMKRKETKEQTNRFDIVLLDMWSKARLITPDGRNTTAREWAKELNVQYGPSLVFFDDEGKEVFRTEAYLRAFHTQSVMDYVASAAYRKQPNLQRYLDGRADSLRERGVEVDLWK